MPSDPTPTPGNAEEIATVNEVLFLLSAKSNWCRGHVVLVKSDGSVARCLIGALHKTDATRRVTEEIAGLCGLEMASSLDENILHAYIARWNDSHSHKNVLQLLSAARASFEQSPFPGDHNAV